VADAGGGRGSQPAVHNPAESLRVSRAKAAASHLRASQPTPRQLLPSNALKTQIHGARPESRRHHIVFRGTLIASQPSSEWSDLHYARVKPSTILVFRPLIPTANNLQLPPKQMSLHHFNLRILAEELVPGDWYRKTRHFNGPVFFTENYIMSGTADSELPRVLLVGHQRRCVSFGRY
jgi:hypothetical protein